MFTHFFLVLVVLILSNNNNNLLNCQKSRPKPCSELLLPKYQSGESQIGSIFEHVLPFACYICTVRECLGGIISTFCRMRARIVLPMYNNMIEFGINGLHLHSKGLIEIKISNLCFFEILIEKDKGNKKNSVTVTAQECSIKTTKKSCEKPGFTKTLDFESNNFYTLTIAAAFYQRDRMHIAVSGRSNRIASSEFEVGKFVRISNRECYANIAAETMKAAIEFDQGDDLSHNGVPLIVPCSPGGYAVDTYTGRFVIGDPCYRMFSHIIEGESGITFIINKIYNNNEDLIFPTKERRSNDLRPIYIDKDGKPVTPYLMRAINKTYNVKANRPRDVCDYEFVRPILNEYPMCDEALKPNNFKISPSEDAFNYYIHKHGCFLCSKPACNFKKADCVKKISIIKEVPLYNNILDFGIVALHLPRETFVEIHYKDICNIKITISEERKMVSVIVQECLRNKCLDAELEISRSISYNNYHCVQIGVAFDDTYKVYFATSFTCSKFAASEFSRSIFFPIREEACQFNKKTDVPFANFTFHQSERRTHDGVQLILPCSTGGYAIDPQTGRFVVGEKCRTLLWESTTRQTGLTFIIRDLFNENENLLFPTESDREVPYPNPIYLRKNGSLWSKEEGAPKIIKNKLMEYKFRDVCDIKDLNATNGASIANQKIKTKIKNKNKNKTISSAKFIETTKEPRIVAGKGIVIVSKANKIKYNIVILYMIRLKLLFDVVLKTCP